MPRKNRKGRKPEKGKQVATASPKLAIAEYIDTPRATEHAPNVKIHAERATQQVSRGETIKPARNGGYRHSWDSPMAGYCYTVYR